MLTLDVGPGFPASSWSFEGGLLTVVIARAYAPGAPVTIDLVEGGSRRSITAKTIGSKRRDDDAFEVRMRPVSLTRENRALLEGRSA